MALASLDLELEVFQGPFDLLLSLVLREEVDLLEVDLVEVVLAYVEHLERAGELELEPTTEFLVLIAALLELKSRMMLPGEEGPDELELEPGEAVEELLGRLLEYHRYRGAAGFLRDRLAEEAGFRHRAAGPPARLRRVAEDVARQVYEPAALAAALGGLLRRPEPLDLRHAAAPLVSVDQRLAHLRALLARRGRFDFDEGVEDADRLTQAVTLFALLELYKAGEADWRQDEPFGPIEVEARRPPPPPVAAPSEEVER